jgi:hypothetical protein
MGGNTATFRRYLDEKPDSALVDFVDLVGHESVGFLMDPSRGFWRGRFDEAVDRLGLLVDPIVSIIHAVLALYLEVLLMCFGYGLGGYALHLSMGVHVERHAVVSDSYLKNFRALL